MAGVTLHITSARPGFWRAGRQWTGTTVIAEADLPAATRSALEADPNFTVAAVAGAAPAGETEFSRAAASAAASGGGGASAPTAEPGPRRKQAQSPD